MVLHNKHVSTVWRILAPPADLICLGFSHFSQEVFFTKYLICLIFSLFHHLLKYETLICPCVKACFARFSPSVSMANSLPSFSHTMIIIVQFTRSCSTQYGSD